MEEYKNFFEWIESQNADIRYDCIPLQHKFEDQRQAAFLKICAFIKLKNPWCDNSILSLKNIETFYNFVKESGLITASDMIQLLTQYILQKQITYISGMTLKENIPFQVGAHAFRFLSTTVYNPFNKDLFRLVIRIHYRTMIRFPAIVAAFTTIFALCGHSATEAEVLRLLIKDFDEKAINVFTSSIQVK